GFFYGDFEEAMGESEVDVIDVGGLMIFAVTRLEDLDDSDGVSIAQKHWVLRA
ncbi:hypothetical protein KI387_012713, partial [Taxus chinensis]